MNKKTRFWSLVTCIAHSIYMFFAWYLHVFCVALKSHRRDVIKVYGPMLGGSVVSGGGPCNRHLWGMDIFAVLDYRKEN